LEAEAVQRALAKQSSKRYFNCLAFIHAVMEAVRQQSPNLGAKTDTFLAQSTGSETADRSTVDRGKTDTQPKDGVEKNTHATAEKAVSHRTPEPSRRPWPRRTALVLAAVLGLLIPLAVMWRRGADADSSTPAPEDRQGGDKTQERSWIANAPVTGDARRFRNSIGMEFVFISPGKFMMGADNRVDPDAEVNQAPRHRVHVSGGFAMGAHKVRQADYRQILDRNPSHFFSSVNLPVDSPTWFDAIEFCNELSTREGLRPYYEILEIRRTDKAITAARVRRLEGGNGYRLPSEAEWEYCARCEKGETYTKFWFGNDIAQLGNYAWYANNSGGQVHSVGQKKPNGWGLYDMGGLLFEWTEDVWHSNYDAAPQDGSAWLADGEQELRVIRGGAWSGSPERCRCGFRYGFEAGKGYDGAGFRVVRASLQK
jgi:formylglycine-generating enzyme required for sulfatase activity